MLNPHHLMIFHAIARTGGISSAAEKLMISQPAVSKQMRALERAVKAKLFDRHSRGVTLTAAGNELAGYATRICSLLDEADQGAH